jgi:hypothetical protein
MPRPLTRGRKEDQGDVVGDDSVVPTPPRRRATTDDDQDVGDIQPTYHKLEFPKFDDTGDTLPWLNWCEHYFHVCWTRDHKKGVVCIISPSG